MTEQARKSTSTLAFLLDSLLTPLLRSGRATPWLCRIATLFRVANIKCCSALQQARR